MTPYTKALLFFQGHANHPYHPQKMVGVSMSYKDIMEVNKLQVYFFHLIEYAITRLQHLPEARNHHCCTK